MKMMRMSCVSGGKTVKNKYMLSTIFKRTLRCILASILSISFFCHAQGFLKMPDTTEVPEYERESMLLDMDIPPVRERNPDPTEGPRLNIKEFRIQGIVEFPELGITREALIKRVESIRFDLMKEDELGKWGYTEKEISEIADLLAQIESETKDSHVEPVDVQRLIFLVRDQRRNRGVTLGMVENVGDVITRFYREKGFILAKAFIPEQKVRDGVVTLTLLLGELGQVEVVNNKRVSEKLIVRAFAPHINQPVTNQRLEEALYLVNDIPGVSAHSLLSPGDQVGDTKLRLTAKEEERFAGNVRFDNHGSESTSKNRLYLDTYFYNPLGWGDEIYLALLKTYEPEKSDYGAFRYNSFWGLPRLRTSVGYSNNDFVSRDVRKEGEPIFTGESEVKDVSLGYQLKRLRVKNYLLQIKYSEIDTELTTVASETNETVKKTSLIYNFDLLNETRRQLYVGNVAVHHSESTERGGLYGFREDTAEFATYDFTMLAFIRFPFTQKETRLLVKNSGQYAGTALTNINQMSLTGPNRARGFEVNGLQTDDAIFLGIDWVFGFPEFGGFSVLGEKISHVVQPYMFVDGAYGQIHPVNNGDEMIEGKISNIGIGLKLNHKRFGANFLASKVMQDDVKKLQNQTPEAKFYGEVSFKF